MVKQFIDTMMRVLSKDSTEIHTESHNSHVLIMNNMQMVVSDKVFDKAVQEIGRAGCRIDRSAKDLS